MTGAAASADIVIAGAGILGLSTAFQLARRSRARIRVIERGSGLGEGSTGASSAVCRFKYSHAEMVELARDSIAAYRHWQEFVALEKPIGRFRRQGVLWLGNGDRRWPQAESHRLAQLGIRTDVLSDDDVHRTFPMLSTCVEAPDLESALPHACVEGGSHLFECDGGYMEPVDALTDLAEACRRAGVEISLGQEVTRINTVGGRIAGVTLADGQAIACGMLVNAVGAWCRRLFEMAGLPLSWDLRPTRIQIVQIDRPAGMDGDLPITVDTTGGIYFRTQKGGQEVIVGSIREEDEREWIDNPDRFAPYHDDEFAAAKLHALQHRLPEAILAGRVRGYSGLYTINYDDMHPIVGETPIGGLYAANGCSGHGFKLGPAIGSILAQAITGTSRSFDTAVDPAFLAFDRVPIPLETRSVLA